MTYYELEKLASAKGKIKRIMFIRDIETGEDIEIDIDYHSGKIKTVKTWYDLPLTAIRFLSVADVFKAWHSDTRIYIVNAIS